MIGNSPFTIDEGGYHVTASGFIGFSLILANDGGTPLQYSRRGKAGETAIFLKYESK